MSVNSSYPMHKRTTNVVGAFCVPRASDPGRYAT